jgi:hypothetical protein
LCFFYHFQQYFRISDAKLSKRCVVQPITATPCLLITYDEREVRHDSTRLENITSKSARTIRPASTRAELFLYKPPLNTRTYQPHVRARAMTRHVASPRALIYCVVCLRIRTTKHKHEFGVESVACVTHAAVPLRQMHACLYGCTS